MHAVRLRDLAHRLHSAQHLQANFCLNFAACTFRFLPSLIRYPRFEDDRLNHCLKTGIHYKVRFDRIVTLVYYDNG